jgi:hypothetical protein
MGLLWTVIAILLVIWLVGLVMNVVGPIIHLLLIIAAVLFVVNMFTGRRTV